LIHFYKRNKCKLFEAEGSEIRDQSKAEEEKIRKFRRIHSWICF